MAKVPSRTSMSSLPASSGPRTSNNRVRIREPPAAVATQLTRPRRRHSMTQPPPQPISHSQAADDSTDTLENHSVCLKTVKDLEGDLHKVEGERDRLLQENETLRQQLSQAQDARSVGHTWEDIQRVVHGAQEALNTCHQQLIHCNRSGRVVRHPSGIDSWTGFHVGEPRRGAWVIESADVF